MRKLKVFNLSSLDGFFSGPGGEIDWFNSDAEMSEFSASQLGNSDTILFGRVTYELMARYWPTAEARMNDPAVAPWMNAIPKVVFSRTLAKADWSNSRVVREDASREVERLKSQSGRDIIIFGSANLMSGLMRSGLIDEFEVMVNPIILGRGRPLFQEIEQPLRLKLLGSRTFRNGNVLLSYAPA